MQVEYEIPEEIKRRYLFDGNIEQLALRVSSFVKTSYEAEFFRIIAERKFFPSGNTLVVGEHALQPNCSIIGEINELNYDIIEKRAIVLLNQRIGIGFDLSTSEDPVAILKKLAKLCESVELWQGRPGRGNIATLSIHHPKVTEFINCKAQSQEAANELKFFNISVSIDNRAMEYESEKLMEIAKAAHAFGDPGIVFIDRVQGNNEEGRIKTAVPCGEQFMHDNETCNLGAINLDAFIIINEQTQSCCFDIQEYVKTIELATRLLDSIIDCLEIPDEEMRLKSLKLRRVGLGVMGFSTTLKTLKIKYDSQEAIDFAKQLSYTLGTVATETSRQLARECGQGENSRRNISNTCIAPTGGIRRLVANDGYAIEPNFSEALSIDPKWSIKMVSAWQAHIDNGISKTLNLKNDTSAEFIYDLFKYAFKKGCKGITVYRDGCRSNQPIQCDGDSCSRR